MNNTNKNKYGQYFTPPAIVNLMISLADLNLSSKIIEPSCGEGVFIEHLLNKGYTNIVGYEIDDNLGKKYDIIKYESFVSAEIDEKVDLVIGNPPYIRWKNLEDELKIELKSNAIWNKYFNSLCDYLYIFILKSIEILKENGQLIFICPEYWMNTTHSQSLRDYMTRNGGFEVIYKFNETKIFDKINVSLVIFKFIKTKKPQEFFNFYNFNDKLKIKDILQKIEEKDLAKNLLVIKNFNPDSRWVFAKNKELKDIEKLEKSCSKFNSNLFNDVNYYTIKDVCDVGNGLVSGLDKAFKLMETKNLNDAELDATLNVLKGYNLEQFTQNGSEKYIFLNSKEVNELELKNNYPNFYNQLIVYKEKLEKRYQYNKKIPYWEWVFLRNIKSFQSEELKIFIPSKNRISNTDKFKFSLVDKNFFPTQDVSVLQLKNTIKESVYYICAFLNHPIVFNWIKHNGIIKGNIVEFSAKPLKSIPFRKIDWSNPFEVECHDKIERSTKLFLKSENKSYILDTFTVIDKLIGN